MVARSIYSQSCERRFCSGGSWTFGIKWFDGEVNVMWQFPLPRMHPPSDGQRSYVFPPERFRLVTTGVKTFGVST